MTNAEKSVLTIGEVSALTGLAAHTLRFYEQEGLLTACSPSRTARRTARSGRLALPLIQ
ncbi:MerR family DNA-binding transcriptional regulator [Streptomyces sp. Inha503]|uniref:MerR family DNA-binding transcriptional regulator n=1 Tax=Streptomyces sp. Inha503 TaxID=3383314 RepID=UPI0039A2D4FE